MRQRIITSAWAEQLKGQTIIEDTMSGKGERAAMVEQQHQRIMEHMTHDPRCSRRQHRHVQHLCHDASIWGGQDMLLVSDPRVEPVAMTGGGKCPATAPVKHNVRDQRRDHAQPVARFYPGYMYVLDENRQGPRKKTPTRKPR